MLRGHCKDINRLDFNTLESQEIRIPKECREMEKHLVIGTASTQMHLLCSLSRFEIRLTLSLYIKLRMNSFCLYFVEEIVYSGYYGFLNVF